MFFKARLGVVLCFLLISSQAFGQKLTLGVTIGASLTDDYRATSFTNFGGATRYVSDASEWFMFGPTFELALPGRFSFEVDAIRRRIRSRRLDVLAEPLELNGITISQLGPFISDGIPWQFSTLAKYRKPSGSLTPFAEGGFSFLPQENRDYTGITAGVGVAIPMWRLNLAPALRYTRWLNNNDLGAVPDQLQFLIGVQEQSESTRPRVLGRPLSLGLVAGFGVSKLLRDKPEPEFSIVSTSDSIPPLGGIQFELPLYKELFVEVDGLYRPTHSVTNLVLADGSIRKGSPSAFLTWVFPMLVKHRKPASQLSPLIEFGPSFRAISHANSESYSHYGITAGLGLSKRVHELNIEPAVRYTRWAAEKVRFGHPPNTATNLDQFEVVLGISFK